MEYSMYHTIAGKTNSTVSKVIDKYKVGNDIIVPYHDAKGKLRYRKFYNEGFKRKTTNVLYGGKRLILHNRNSTADTY